MLDRMDHMTAGRSKSKMQVELHHFSAGWKKISESEKLSWLPLNEWMIRSHIDGGWCRMGAVVFVLPEKSCPKPRDSISKINEHIQLMTLLYF